MMQLKHTLAGLTCVFLLRCCGGMQHDCPLAAKDAPLFDCIYGDEEMHVDVDMTFSLYNNACGNWKNFGPEFGADQKWAK